MIKSFSSSPAPTTAPTGTGGKGMDKLIPIILGGIALYLVWKFVIKPEMDKEQVRLAEAETEE